MDPALPITQKSFIRGVCLLKCDSCGQSKSKLSLFFRCKIEQNSEDGLKL